jgi:hypothetical protein
MEDSQEKWILPSQLSDAVPLDRIHKVPFLHVKLLVGDWAEILKTDSEKGLYLDNTAV